MKLLDLQPVFVRLVNGGLQRVATLEAAQGVRFLCPKCFEVNKGPIGTHSVICWSRSRGVPDDATPGPGRWQLIGTDFSNLTLGAEPNQLPSVQLTSGCTAHFCVVNGEIVGI